MQISAIDVAIASGLVSGCMVPLGQFLLGFWRSRRDERVGTLRAKVDQGRLEVEEREAAGRTLLQTVGSLREDIARLRGELDAERKLRTEAEEQVRALRVEIEALRCELRQTGGAVCKIPLSDRPCLPPGAKPPQ